MVCDDAQLKIRHLSSVSKRQLYMSGQTHSLHREGEAEQVLACAVVSHKPSHQLLMSLLMVEQRLELWLEHHHGNNKSIELRLG